MSKSHYIVPTGQSPDIATVRLGATGSANNLSDVDNGKFVKLAATDRYDLAAAGDAIEAVITSVEQGTSGGFSIGGIARCERGDKLFVTADGLQATAGTGTIAAGDRVVVGTAVAKGTAQSGYPKVCKATVQPGDVPASLTAAGAQVLASLNSWKVVSLGTVGSGAVGTVIVIEKE